MSLRSMKIFFLGFLFFTQSNAQDISSYLKKHKLSPNVNVLAVSVNDCFNCYFGLSQFFTQHEKELSKKNFVLVFNKISQEELKNFFTYTLKVDRSKFTTLIDPGFYTFLNAGFTSALYVVERGSVTSKYDQHSISQVKDLAGGSLQITEGKTLDVKKIFGTSHLNFSMLDGKRAVFVNDYSSLVSVLNISTKKITDTLGLSFFPPLHDSVLRTCIKDPETLQYNLSRYKNEPAFRSYPLYRMVSGPFTKDGEIYLALYVSLLEIPKEKNNVIINPTPVVFRFNDKLKLTGTFSIPSYPKRAVDVIEMSVFNRDTLILDSKREPVDEHNYGDSVAALYSLKSTSLRILPLNYDAFIPLVNNQNIPIIHKKSVWRSHGSLLANFNAFPYVYNLSTQSKIKMDGISFDENNPENNFWVYAIVSRGNKNVVIAAIEKGSVYSLIFNADFTHLLNKRKLLNGSFVAVSETGNAFYGLETSSDKVGKDKAVLHTFTIGD